FVFLLPVVARIALTVAVVGDERFDAARFQRFEVVLAVVAAVSAQHGGLRAYPRALRSPARATPAPSRYRGLALRPRSGACHPPQPPRCSLARRLCRWPSWPTRCRYGSIGARGPWRSRAPAGAALTIHGSAAPRGSAARSGVARAASAESRR